MFRRKWNQDGVDGHAEKEGEQSAIFAALALLAIHLFLIPESTPSTGVNFHQFSVISRASKHCEQEKAFDCEEILPPISPLPATTLWSSKLQCTDHKYPFTKKYIRRQEYFSLSFSCSTTSYSPTMSHFMLNLKLQYLRFLFFLASFFSSLALHGCTFSSMEMALEPYDPFKSRGMAPLLFCIFHGEWNFLQTGRSGVGIFKRLPHHRLHKVNCGTRCH